MQYTITISEHLFSNDEIEKLKDLLGTNGEDEFQEAINKVAHAALSEYKAMFLGISLPSRADEMLQYRLYHLIKHFFVDRLPSETEVSSMFQLTQTKSRSLIRNTTTRFRYELEKERDRTLRQTIDQAYLNEEAGEYRVVIKSDNILEELNQIVAQVTPNLDPIRKVRNMSGTYCMSEDTYQALFDYLEVGFEHDD